MEEFIITKNFSMDVKDIVGSIKLNGEILQLLLKEKMPIKLSYSILQTKHYNEIQNFSILIEK